MPGVVLIAGMADKPFVKEGYDVIGVDYGAFVCLSHQVEMVSAIGDFDSVSSSEYEQLKNACQLHQLPAHKNETDTEVAIQYALDKGYDDIYVYGALGGRLDHEAANLYLLIHREYPIKLVNDTNCIRVVKEGTYQVKKEYTYLSFLPLCNSCISEKGVAYPLDHQEMDVYDIYGTSNEIMDEYAEIIIHKGAFLMIESSDS